MHFYPSLDKPGFLVSDFRANTYDPDLKDVLVHSLPTEILGTSLEGGSNRAIPFLGYRNGEPIFGFYLDNGGPNFNFIKAVTTDSYNGGRFSLIPDTDEWLFFLSTLDSYMDFQGKTLGEESNDDPNIDASPITVQIYGVNDDKEWYLYIKKGYGVDTYNIWLKSGPKSQATLFLDPFGLSFNCASNFDLKDLTTDINNITSRMDRIEGVVSSTFVSR